MSRQSKAKRRSPEQIKVSLTDPEAPLGLDKTKVFRPLFNVQFACDLDSPFILGYGGFAAATDANLLGPLSERTQELTGTTPEVVLNDNNYANILNLKLCDEQRGHDVCPPAESSESARGVGLGRRAVAGRMRRRAERAGAAGPT